MDPVQKAVIHHTFGVPPSPKRKYISCGVCQLRFNSQVSRRRDDIKGPACTPWTLMLEGGGRGGGGVAELASFKGQSHL